MTSGVRDLPKSVSGRLGHILSVTCLGEEAVSIQKVTVLTRPPHPDKSH